MGLVRLVPVCGAVQGVEVNRGRTREEVGEIIRATTVVYYTCPTAVREHVPGQRTPELGLGRCLSTPRSHRTPLLFTSHSSYSSDDEKLNIRQGVREKREKERGREREREAKRAQTKKLTAQVSLDVGQNYNEIEETRRAELRREMGVHQGLPPVASCPPSLHPSHS